MAEARRATDLPQQVQEVVDRIVEGYDPEKIIIFGSFARGTWTEDSDLDLLVIKDTDARWLDRVVEVSGFCTPRLLSMDIIVSTPREVRDALPHSELFMREVMREGVVAYQRQGE
ncbi:MAG: nucleotidyltransferase domain-containing protein [Armatimonadota bacterium]|nr:nucleotidyltransferase domain-containing protein [Armatimonadota bacterium]